MNPKIQAVLDAQKTLAEAMKSLNKALDEIKTIETPVNLRPATPEDVVVGAVLYYLKGDDGPFCNLVDEVYRPSDPWKAYCAHDGCRYGLEGAFVEVEE